MRQDKQDRESLCSEILRGACAESQSFEPRGFQGESAILFYVGWGLRMPRQSYLSRIELAGLMLQVALNPLCDMAGYALVPLQRSRLKGQAPGNPNFQPEAPATVIAPVTGMDIATLLARAATQA